MSVHDQLMKNMQEVMQKFSQRGVNLQLPPASSLTLGTHYIELEYGKVLVGRVNYNAKFGNPLFACQGGFLCAIFDEVYGPLMFMATEFPAVTIEMSTTYIRPFTEKDEFIIVRAEIVAQTKTLLIMKGDAKSKEGKLIATSTTHALVLSDQNLTPKKAA